MVAIKTTLKELPKYCEECQWYSCKPHPYKGWIEICEYMSHSLNDNKSEEWTYNGNGRPKACPLVWVDDMRGDTE